MARRRSRNRRASRKSLNITELDEDSEFLETHDALWWKNIEADMTVRQSRRPSYADATSPILNESSFVDASELRDDWWKTLGRPSVDASRRVSARRSVRASEARGASSGSEASGENVERKRRTSRSPARRGRSADSVAVAASEAAVIADSRKTGSSQAGEARRDETRDNPVETSVNTSDADPNSRPKPFKKRFAKIPDGIFDEFGNEATGRENAVDALRESRERGRANASLDGTRSRSSSKVQDLEGVEAGGSPTVMGPPRSVSRRKRRASSLARRHETTSEESEADVESTKRRSRVARKMRKTVSINPFDEIIVEATERDEESIAISENVEKVKRGTSQAGRSSLNRRIGEGSSDKDENLRDSSFETSRVETKILEVSLTRISPRKHEDDEISPAEKAANERRLAAFGSVRPFIEDSAYELPDPERSATPQISDSESANVRSPGNSKSPRTPARTSPSTSAARKNLAASSRRSLAASNNSRTKIFSDEDISLEDLSYVGRHGNLVMTEVEASRESERGVAASVNKSVRNVGSDERRRKSAVRSYGRRVLANRSRLSEESDVSSGEDETEVAAKKDFARSRRDSRRSRASALRKSEIRERSNPIERTIGKEGIDVAEEIDRESANSSQARLRGNVDVSNEKPNNSRAQIDPAESPDEPNDFGKSHSASSNTRLKRESRKSLGPRRSGQIVGSPDEPEVAARTKSANLSRPRANSRTSGKNLAARGSQLSDAFDESSSENGGQAVDGSHGQPRNPNLTGKSVREKSVAEKSLGKKLVPEKSVSEKLVSEKSVSEKSVSEKSASEKSASEKSASEKSASEKSASEKSASEKSASEKLASEKSVSEKSVSEKSALEKSVSEKSVPVKSVAGKSIPERSLASATRVSRRRLIQSDASTSAGEDDPAEKSASRPATRLTDVSRKSVVPVNESRDREVLEDEDEAEEDAEPEVSAREPSRTPERSSTASKSGRRIASVEQDTRLRPEETRHEDPKLSSSPATENLRVSPKTSMIDESPAHNRSEPARETKADSVRKSPRSEGSVASRQSVREFENEIENASEAPQRSSPSVERTPRKSFSSARPSRNILTLSHAPNFRDSVTRENLKLVSSTPNVAAPRASIVSRSKTSTPARAQKSITDFYPSKFLQRSHESTTTTTTTRETAPRFDPMKMKEVKEKVEELKRRELEAMSLETRKNDNTKKRPFVSIRKASPTKPTTSRKPTKIVDKAYIVNGKVYKRPKLPRPKPWATDRLYRHLWKLMEPKFESSTRVKSEKFVLSLSEVVTLAIRRKKYESYKPEVDALMKEMAKLGIVRTPNDFYDFCYDFMPYEFRVKVTPILLPGNGLSIPYDPDKLHTPILENA